MPIFSFIMNILLELFGKLTIGGKYINKRIWLSIHEIKCVSKMIWDKVIKNGPGTVF